MSYPGDLSASHCAQLTAELAECRAHRPQDFEKGSIIALFFHFACSFTALTMLKTQPAVRSSFTQCCAFFHQVARYWPAAVALLKGLQATAHQMNVELPPESIPYFSNLYAAGLNDTDVPVSWAIPGHAELAELLNDDSTDSEQTRVELGNLISQWNSLSIQA